LFVRNVNKICENFSQPGTHAARTETRQQYIVTFAVSHTVFEKYDVKQSNGLEICPRSLTVVSPESCRVAMYVKCSEESERKKQKSPFRPPHSHLTPTLQRTPANIRIKLTLVETRIPGLHFCR